MTELRIKAWFNSVDYNPAGHSQRCCFMQTVELTQVQTLERRCETRKQSLIHAFVSDFNDLVDLKCVIRETSKNGCRIASSYVEDLPQLVRITPEGVAKPLVGKICLLYTSD